MATLVLQVAGSAIGQALGGPVGAAIGSAAGGIAGRMIDQAWMSPRPRAQHGPRLTNQDGISAQEGAAIPRIYGRVKLGGQVIWATEFEEARTVEKAGGSGGKSMGGGQAQKTVRYSYFANVAIALCEGPVSFVRRIWADGKPLDLAGVTMRFYHGGADQMPDPLIVAKQGRGDIPAFRGTAYVVFERLPLADYGNRLPQFSFEVVRAGEGLPRKLKAINIIPGASEFAYAPQEVREDFGYGHSRALNRTQWTHTSDWEASLDQLQALSPNLESVTLINAWFGDDLRVGNCTLRPKTEKSVKATIGTQWQAAGLTRATALPVSASNDRPNYGGSPSDASVIAAIRDVKTRGLAVTLHPFVLMDIPAANALLDPYTGAVGQPAFPWRGRITSNPAPGRAGSPEGTAAIATQVAAFFGMATAAQFALAGETVVYTGPAEWGYRRMVLHNAMLAKAAGGVEAFYLGSELVGLTHLSSGNGVFPAVQALIALAAEVRSILGAGTLITYAADWTEYGARVRGQELRFPLDPLWANANIGAVAIDLYPPLSDWRAGRDHADAAIAESAADGDYLKSRIASGEGFDWYYADDQARAAQTRLPISDGTYGKPWVYRPKDLAGWWGNAHKERVGGVELAISTGWVAQSKPIILAEIGCPSVDKGANQPNVFPDPKSIENALPYFSHGGRDDLVQRRLIEAYCDRFDPEGDAFNPADNPVSGVYGGRMVQADRIAPWAWDARPFPAFPDTLSLWSDGANWARGHWLNGRLEALPVAELIRMILADHGHDAPLLAGVDGMIDGYVVDRPMSARAALEPVLDAFGIAARVSGDVVVFSGERHGFVATITRDDLVPAKDGAEITIVRREASEVTRAATLGFADSAREFRASIATARMEEGEASREGAEATALVMPRGLAQRLVEERLRAMAGWRETLRFSVRPRLFALEPGDRVQLETPQGVKAVMITRITDVEAREVEARMVESVPPDALPQGDDAAPEPGLPALPGAAFARLIDLPLERSGAFVAAAVRAEPWRGPYSISRVSGGVELLASVDSPARIGATLTALPAGPLWRWQKGVSLDIRLENGAISSLSEEATLAGGNTLLLIAPDGESEIILYREAVLVGEKRYRLTGLLRGMGTSESTSARLLAAGAEVIVLDEAVISLPLGTVVIGQPQQLLVLPAGRDAADATAIQQAITPQGRALRCLAPVHARAKREAGGVRIQFMRRTRSDGDNLDAYEVPLGEEREAYLLEIRAGATLKRSVTLAAPEWLYASADELADFGAAQNQLALSIQQISAVTGPGDALNRTIPVT